MSKSNNESNNQNESNQNESDKLSKNKVQVIYTLLALEVAANKNGHSLFAEQKSVQNQTKE